MRQSNQASAPGREPSKAADGGVAIKVAASAAADGGRASGAPAASQPGMADNVEEDAGRDKEPATDVKIDTALGNTGLRVSDILGYYSSNWGQMVLRTVNDEIWGVYEYRDGTIIGQVNDEGVFRGWWTQLPSRVDMDAGEVEFRWSRIANNTIALDGRWRYGSDGDWLENWDTVRVTDRSPPASLTDRFEVTDDFKHRPQ